MKITVVTPLFAIAGVPLAQLRLARSLASRGHDVDLVFGRIDPEFVLPETAGFSVINLNCKNVRSMFFPLLQHLKTKSPAIIFSAEDHLNAIVILAVIASGSMALLSCSSRVTPFDTYSNKLFTKRWILKQIARLVMWRADVLTCVSRDMVTQYRQVFKNSKHVCVYNIVADPAFSARSKEAVSHAWLKKSAHSTTPTLIAAGRLAPWKGFGDLIDAVALVKAKMAVRLLILGDGPLRDELQTRINIRGLADCVQLLGYVQNPLPYFSLADIFVLSSHVEGLPNVLVEAMMCGCTPVATDCPTGPREVLDDGRYGYLVSPRDPVSIAEGIMRAIKDPLPSDLLGKAVRPFREDSVIQRHFELLGLSDFASDSGGGRLKVALNGTCFNDRASGAKQRFLGIYRELAPRMPQVEFTIFAPADCRMEGWFNGISNIHIRTTTIPSEGRLGKFIHARLFWRKALLSERFDLFEGFHLPLPEVPFGKTVITLHDVRHLHSDSGWLDRMAFRVAFDSALNKADTFITVSEAIKREVQPFCGRTPIHVIPNGLELAFRDPPSDEARAAFQRRFGLPDAFVLAVGHLESRKNYSNLIEAIARLRDIGFDCHLIIIGNDSGHRALLESKITSLKLGGQITLLSGLSDIEVRCAYALCSLFVFPSSYEGFGIPILEAMAASCPMALADIPVFREITEGRSAYFSPSDPRDMAYTIARILTSPEEQARLIQYGRERIKSFSYSDIAARYERLYVRVLGLS